VSVAASTGPPRAPTSASSEALLRSALTLLTNVGVLTGLLVYFGWKRTAVQASQLGIDETLFGFTTRDYLLRSVDALFVPIGLAAVAGLGFLWLDRWVRSRARSTPPGPWTTRAVAALRWAWVLLPLAGFLVGSVSSRVGAVTFPLSFGLGALLTAYGFHLRRELGVPADGVDAARWRTEPTRVLVAIVVVLSVFWTITNVADSRGRALATRLEAQVARRPAVVVHSAAPLGLEVPGVSEQRVGPDAYRYDGLRLLHHRAGTFLLVHDGWRRDDGVLLVLHDDGELRFEFVTGAG
jgi:hypothetical protein